MNVTLHTGATLVDILTVLQDVQHDEVLQYEQFTGAPWDANHVAAALFLSDGPKWTMAQEGEFPLAVCGFMPYSPGVWRTWMAAKAGVFETAGRQVTKHCRGVMDYAAAEPSIHRIECRCLSSRQKALDWYPRIGLSFESVQRGSGAFGADVSLFVRVRPQHVSG